MDRTFAKDESSHKRHYSRASELIEEEEEEPCSVYFKV